jgi:hypothetical protein
MRGTVITPHYHPNSSQLALTCTMCPLLQLLSIGAHTMAGSRSIALTATVRPSRKPLASDKMSEPLELHCAESDA